MCHTVMIKSMVKLHISASNDAISDSSATMSGLKSIVQWSQMESAYNKHTQTSTSLAAGASVVEGRTDKDVFSPRLTAQTDNSHHGL